MKTVIKLASVTIERSLILGIACLMILIGCQTKQQEEKSTTQQLYDQVMDIHDEVMPRMGKINRLSRTLKEQLKQEGMPEVETQEIKATIALLDSADFAMMDWMHKFSPLPDSVDSVQANAYLRSELKNIEMVKALIIRSIQTAERNE